MGRVKETRGLLEATTHTDGMEEAAVPTVALSCGPRERAALRKVSWRCQLLLFNTMQQKYQMMQATRHMIIASLDNQLIRKKLREVYNPAAQATRPALLTLRYWQDRWAFSVRTSHSPCASPAWSESLLLLSPTGHGGEQIQPRR